MNHSNIFLIVGTCILGYNLVSEQLTPVSKVPIESVITGQSCNVKNLIWPKNWKWSLFTKLVTYIHVCNGWNFRLGLRERLLMLAIYKRVQCRTPATAVQLLLHVQDSTESACSVCTGYVFFGTLVDKKGYCHLMQCYI